MPEGKAILRVNLDETSVCLFQGDRKGTVFVKRKRRQSEPVQKVARGKRRCCLTHVAMVCDSTEIQPKLPQVVIGNTHTFKAGAFAELQASCPPNVTLVRQKSAWNNSSLCATIIRWLGRALRPYAERYQPILILDAARLHLSSGVLRACAVAGIWPIVVPAKLTWLLQPLDTHAFQLYKSHLKRAYQRARAEAHGDLDVKAFLPCLYETIRRILQGSRWASAFDRDGFGCAQAAVSVYVLRQLQLEAPLRIPASRPSLEDIKLCFPSGAKIPMATLFRPFDRPVASLHAASGDVPEAILAPRGPALLVAEPRTRGQRRAAEAVAVAAKDAAAAPAHAGPGAASSSAMPALAPGPVLGRTRAETRRLRSRAASSASLPA